ncbi:uncharacterized protein [Paramormyrops kingsleyae]|uniref:uncharacterized protein isoform X2 n=1 Tax=Paramormyrops kingsleyae TaxID=1676925 RepID=UPI000CD61C8E|nr:uncharacterized protein LOC111833513 isoform X2 [Paramormyrops kingsleyae]
MLAAYILACPAEKGGVVWRHQLSYSERSPAQMSDTAPVLPVPLLTQEHSQTRGNVDLLCRAPPGHGGVMFQLYQDKNLVDNVSFTGNTPEARFTLKMHLAMEKRFCCLYQDQDKVYSHFSQYMKPVETNLNTAAVPPPALSDDGGEVDWPLIAGSLSASILFMAALGCLGFAVYMKVKALAEKRRKREEALFWHHMHATDRVVDLTLRRISVGSQDWTPCADDRVGGTAGSPSASLSGSQYPFSTFRNLSSL